MAVIKLIVPECATGATDTHLYLFDSDSDAASDLGSHSHAESDELRWSHIMMFGPCLGLISLWDDWSSSAPLYLLHYCCTLLTISGF
jgi:hypothetical protein